MVHELWSFFRKKLGKGNGVWWALSYTRLHWQWLRFKARHYARHVDGSPDPACWMCDQPMIMGDGI